MEIAFRTRRLERAYIDSGRARRAWGPVVGAKYIQRVDLLQSLRTWTDARRFPGMRLHPLKGSRAGTFALTLHGRWRLIVTHDAATNTLKLEEVSRHYGD